MAAHNPLSAKLAAQAGFDAIWGSGFELSASYAVPDANILSMETHLEMMRAFGAAVDTDYATYFHVPKRPWYDARSYHVEPDATAAGYFFAAAAITRGSVTVNGLSGDRVQNALTVYYDDVIQTLANTLRSTISSTQRLPKLDQSVPIVLSGDWQGAAPIVG